MREEEEEKATAVGHVTHHTYRAVAEKDCPFIFSLHFRDWATFFSI